MTRYDWVPDRNWNRRATDVHAAAQLRTVDRGTEKECDCS